MAKKTTRYFAIAFTTKDGRDLKAKNLQFDLPRGAIAGRWHSKSGQKKRIEMGKCGYRSAYGDMSTLLDFMEAQNYLDEDTRAFVVEISGRFDVDFDEEFIASENIRFIREIKDVTSEGLTEAAKKYSIVTESQLESLRLSLMVSGR